VPSYTPVATPVVPAPERSQAERARDAGLRPELVAPVTVITPQGDIELGSGSLLIGRLPECDVLLQDGLVSRMHARISVQHESVVVEDLHSTNGVYVNGLRVGHSAVLREGDRVLIGTTEISMFESRDSSLTRIKQARRQSPSDSPAIRIESPRSAPTPPSAATKPIIAPAPATPQRVAGRLDQVPSTARADALKMIGGLAARLAATGNIEEATQVLSGHLRRILKGANAGLEVPADVAGSASHHALTLARWTRQASWADYVVELHLSARLVMSAVTLVSFEDVASKLEDFDRMLLGYYVDGLRDRSDTLSLDERKRLERLALLTKG
jgi:pSer/pThr/pTyr-binding forkhead associated (FHA) protein